MDSAQGTRRDPRLLLIQDGRVTTLGEQGNKYSEGTLLDLAVSGLRLEMSHSVDVGATIFFETAASLIVGEVRHCHQSQHGRFTAGVEINDILTDVRFKHNSGKRTAKGIRRKLAEVVLGGRLRPKLP